MARAWAAACAMHARCAAHGRVALSAGRAGCGAVGAICALLLRYLAGADPAALRSRY